MSVRGLLHTTSLSYTIYIMSSDIIAGHLQRHSPDLPRARHVQEEGRCRPGVALQCDEGLQHPRQGGGLLPGQRLHRGAPLDGGECRLLSGRASKLIIFPNTSPSSMNNIRYTAYNNPNIILLSCEKKNIILCSSNTIHLGSKYQYRIGETRERENDQDTVTNQILLAHKMKLIISSSPCNGQCGIHKWSKNTRVVCGSQPFDSLQFSEESC